MQPVGGVGAVQLKLIELEVVPVTVKPPGAAVTAEHGAAGVVVKACVEGADAPWESTDSTE